MLHRDAVHKKFRERDERHKKEAEAIEEARTKLGPLDEELGEIAKQIHKARVESGAKLQLEGKSLFDVQVAAFFETLPDEEGTTLIKRKKKELEQVVTHYQPGIQNCAQQVLDAAKNETWQERFERGILLQRVCGGRHRFRCNPTAAGNLSA